MRRLPLRTRIWLGCVLLSLGLYACRATHLPRRTAIGTEQRLFAGDYTVWPMPGSSQEWLVVPSTEEAVPAPTPTPSSATPSSATPAPTPNAGAQLAATLEAFAWPGGTITGRRLTPFREEGTWAIGPLGLRRMWRHPTDEVSEEHRWLLSQGRTLLLDLASGRTYVGPAAEKRVQELPSPYELEEEEYDFGKDPEELSSLAFPLSGLESSTAGEQKVAVAGRRMVLLMEAPSDTDPGGIFAVSDHEAPRVLKLAEAAEAVRLSGDGRTLFFRRRQALWRLDLRKPLPELLDEAPPGALPDVE